MSVKRVSCLFYRVILFLVMGLTLASSGGCRARSVPRVTEGGGVRIDWDLRQENVRLAGGAVVAGVERYHRGDADDGLSMLETAGSRSRGPVLVTVLVDGEPRPLSGGWVQVVDGRASLVQNVHQVDADVVTTIDPALDAVSFTLRLHAKMASAPELRVEVARGPDDEIVVANGSGVSPHERLPEVTTSFAIVGETPALFVGAPSGSLVVSADADRMFVSARVSSSSDGVDGGVARIDVALRGSRRAAGTVAARLGIGRKNNAIVALAPFIANSRAFLPARVRLEALDLPQTHPLVLDPSRGAEPGTWLVDVTSPDSTITLPPGRYVLRATHGIGWSIARVELSLEAGDLVRAPFALVEEAPAPGTLGCDFHVHAEGSGDARAVTYADRVRSLVAVGVDCAAATEHNHVGDHAPATKKLGLDARYLPISGVEVTTTTMGHFNVYPWPLGAAIPETDDVKPRALFDAIHALPGSFIFQLNHPRMFTGDHDASIGYLALAGVDPMTGKSIGKIGYFSDYDALEIFNGYQLGLLDEVVSVTEEWARMLDRGELHVATGNSDSHGILFPSAGFPRTLVDVGPGFVASGRPVEAIVTALKKGRAIVTSGPIVALHVGEAGIGDTASGGGTIRVVVRLTSWLTNPKARLLLGGDDLGELALTQGTSPGEWIGTRLLEAPNRKRPLVAMVFADAAADASILTGMTRALAITNPVWVLP